MTREDLIDVNVYGAVNDRPAITVAGISYLFRGFTLAQVEASARRLELAGLLEQEHGEGRWSVTMAKP